MNFQNEAPETSAKHANMEVLADIFHEMSADGDKKNIL